MQKDMTILAKETVIYGGTTAIGKLLNYVLVPIHTHASALGTAAYGDVTNIYAYTALLLVILTYGMETGMFRFINREDKLPSQVYTTILTSIGVTSVLFAVFSCLFAKPIASVLGLNQAEYVIFLVLIVAMDAFASIPFAYLRYKRRPIRFMSLKLLQVVINIGFNAFFLLVCPKIQHWSVVAAWYDPNDGVGYVLLSNLLATGIQTLCLLPEILGEKYSFSWSLLRELFAYSLPLLVLGVAGTMNQTLDRILFTSLFRGDMGVAKSQLGIYGAGVKVAMVMMMFTTAFRYAYEPYVFSKHKDKNSVEAYADAMKYYLLFSFLILLGTVFYLDILKFIIGKEYWSGLKVVPIVLWTYVFQGVYLNLSYWYKLTDKTQWGIYFSLIGLSITFLLQVLFVPKFSYMASAMSGTLSFFICMLLSYFIGKRHIAIPYDFKTIGKYTVLTLLLLGIYYAVRKKTPIHAMSVSMVVGTVLLAIYIFVLTRKEFPLSAIPVVGKKFQKADSSTCVKESKVVAGMTSTPTQAHSSKSNIKNNSNMSFFKTIGDLFSEKPEKQEKEVQEPSSTSSNKDVDKSQSAEPKNQELAQENEFVQEPPVQENTSEEKEQKRTEIPLETKEELLRVVRNWFADYSDAVGQSIGNQFVIWLDTDQLTFQMYNTDNYRQRLLAALMNECDLRIDSISFSIGVPAEELRCTPVGKSGKVFLQVVDDHLVQVVATKKAVISIFGNAGSLLKKEYVLSSDEMKTKRISVYNIGAGEFPQVPTGYRENHIAIDDNSNSPMVEKNKFVSRMHAHIGYSETVGFYLQAELDGTRLMGKRTRIFRGEQKIEMDNPQVKEPLQDGDLIELGKAVVLRYVEIND